MAKKSLKPFRDKEGKLYIPVDDEYYIRQEDVEDMFTLNDPNALTRVIMEWKEAYPNGTKEEFIKDSFFSEKTVNNLW